MAERIVSPGVFTNEVDQSQKVQLEYQQQLRVIQISCKHLVDHLVADQAHLKIHIST